MEGPLSTGPTPSSFFFIVLEIGWTKIDESHKVRSSAWEGVTNTPTAYNICTKYSNTLQQLYKILQPFTIVVPNTPNTLQ